MKYSLVTAALIVASSIISTANAAPAQLKGAQFLPQAKVTLAQARATALTAERGTIADQELEREGGRLRYSFDVKTGKVVHEVGVDAITGKVLEDSVDNGHD